MGGAKVREFTGLSQRTIVSRIDELTSPLPNLERASSCLRSELYSVDICESIQARSSCHESLGSEIASRYHFNSTTGFPELMVCLLWRTAFETTICDRGIRCRAHKLDHSAKEELITGQNGAVAIAGSGE